MSLSGLLEKTKAWQSINMGRRKGKVIRISSESFFYRVLLLKQMISEYL
jgi:hypothetical protein